MAKQQRLDGIPEWLAASKAAPHQQNRRRNTHLRPCLHPKDFVLVAMAVQEQVVEFLLQNEADECTQHVTA